MIGQVGPDTKSVETMLRQIGFKYAERIDPFDGGPHFVRIAGSTHIFPSRSSRLRWAHGGKSDIG